MAVALGGCCCCCSFGRETCEIRGEEEEEEVPEGGWFRLEARLWVRISDALVGGDEPSGDGFRGELDVRDDGGFFNAVVGLAGGW